MTFKCGRTNLILRHQPLRISLMPTLVLLKSEKIILINSIMDLDNCKVNKSIANLRIKSSQTSEIY